MVRGFHASHLVAESHEDGGVTTEPPLGPLVTVVAEGDQDGLDHVAETIVRFPGQRFDAADMFLEVPPGLASAQCRFPLLEPFLDFPYALVFLCLDFASPLLDFPFHADEGAVAAQAATHLFQSCL